MHRHVLTSMEEGKYLSEPLLHCDLLHDGGSADGQNIESTFATSRVSGDPELVSSKIKAVLNGRNGLLKEVNIDGRVHKVELQFAKYGCRGRGNSQDNSGSYLFAPDKLSVPVFGQQSSGKVQ